MMNTDITNLEMPNTGIYSDQSDRRKVIRSETVSKKLSHYGSVHLTDDDEALNEIYNKAMWSFEDLEDIFNYWYN